MKRRLLIVVLGAAGAALSTALALPLPQGQAFPQGQTMNVAPPDASVGISAGTPAVPSTSAFEALRLLPPEVAKRIAIIAGREGAPVPQRWYLVVYDPAQEHHLAEYVVAENRVVAARAVSQFAQELSADDVIPTDSALFNSDSVYQIIAQFAQANNVRIPKINYELKKQGVGAVPLWSITCVDDSLAPFAQMTLAAGTGTIIHTDGFTFAPRSIAQGRNSDRPARARASTQEAPAVAESPSDDDSNTEVRDSREPTQERRQLAANRRMRETDREGRVVYQGRRVDDRKRDLNPSPVAQRPAGLFGAIRRLFSR